MEITKRPNTFFSSPRKRKRVSIGRARFFLGSRSTGPGKQFSKISNRPRLDEREIFGRANKISRYNLIVYSSVPPCACLWQLCPAFHSLASLPCSRDDINYTPFVTVRESIARKKISRNERNNERPKLMKRIARVR